MAAGKAKPKKMSSKQMKKTKGGAAAYAAVTAAEPMMMDPKSMKIPAGSMAPPVLPPSIKR